MDRDPPLVLVQPRTRVTIGLGVEGSWCRLGQAVDTASSANRLRLDSLRGAFAGLTPVGTAWSEQIGYGARRAIGGARQRAGHDLALDATVALQVV